MLEGLFYISVDSPFFCRIRQRVAVSSCSIYSATLQFQISFGNGEKVGVFPIFAMAFWYLKNGYRVIICNYPGQLWTVQPFHSCVAALSSIGAKRLDFILAADPYY